MSNARFTARGELAEYEWDNQRKDWKRPKLDREVPRKLSERSMINGLPRIASFVLLLAVSAVAAVYVSMINPWLAIPVSPDIATSRPLPDPEEMQAVELRRMTDEQVLQTLAFGVPIRLGPGLFWTRGRAPSLDSGAPLDTV